MNPYLLYVKLGIAAVLLCILGVFGWKVHVWRQDSLRVDAVEARSEQIAREASQAIVTLHKQQQDAYKASQGYQRELQAIRDNRQPARVVRLCPEPRVPARPAATQRARGPDGSSPGAGALPQEPGPDLGPDLYRLADEADELAARLRALQDWADGD